MKRILLLAAVALLSAPLCVQAQRSEITVSYGYAPTSNWSDSFSAIKDLVSDAKTDISGWGAVTVGYNLRLLGPLSIGAQVVCSTNEQKIKGTNTEIRNRYWAVMPNVKWTSEPSSPRRNPAARASMRPASPIRCRPWASLSADVSRPMPKRASVPRVRSSSVCVTVSDDGRGRGYRRTDSAYGEDGRIVPEHAGGFSREARPEAGARSYRSGGCRKIPANLRR